MKSSSKIIATIVCVLSLAGTLQAQESGGMVAVLDVAKVFESNTAFNQRMNAIKTEAEQFKIQMETQQAQLQQQAEPLKEYKPGSPEFNQLQSRLEQDTARLRTVAQQTNTELLNREAKIYYDTYTNLQQVVAGFAEQFNITLVIRFDDSPIDPANRAEVVKGVNRNVVYQKDLNLTTMVIEKMESLATAGAGGNLNR